MTSLVFVAVETAGIRAQSESVKGVSGGSYG